MKQLTQFIVPFFALVFFLLLYSCIIQNPKPKDCEIISTTVSEIIKGSSYDIVFVSNNGDRYYINRGLERGLNLQDLNATVLNKTVTLHLAKVLGGTITSDHIAQLAIDDTIIFTEID